MNVGGKIWKYRIGRQNVVAFCGNEKKVEKIWKIKGVSPETFERGQWKKTSDGMLFPKEIAEWLKK